jgi:hypothetical protein
VRKLIAGPTVFICDECVQLCSDVCLADIAQHTEEEAKTRAAGWLRRTTELRRAIDALSSTEADAMEPIRGPWVMSADRNTPDGSVKVVLRRRFHEDGDVSISFTETPDDLKDIAEWIVTGRAGSIPPTAESEMAEGIELSLCMSGRALLCEFERRAERLKLAEILDPKPPTEAPFERLVPPELILVREGINRIVEQKPELRREIAEVLRDLVNKLAYTR